MLRPGRKMNSEPIYPVVEVFASRQGEGFNTGREAVFLRMGGCNLACPWCDTPCNNFEMLTANSIKERVGGFGLHSLILTGGEPLVVEGIESLVEYFKNRGYWIAVETNGLSVKEPEVLKLFDYIAVSPKACYSELYNGTHAVKKADEVRITIDGDLFNFCNIIRGLIEAHRYFLSPCECDGEMNIEQTICLLSRLNLSSPQKEWLLSLQTHKLCGIR